MTLTRFENEVKILEVHADHIVATKRPDYTQESTDVLANFKNAANEAGITPLQVWLVHFHKQYSAIARHVKNPNSNPSEPMLDRFADLRNYLQLGWALIKERHIDQMQSVVFPPTPPVSHEPPPDLIPPKFLETS